MLLPLRRALLCGQWVWEAAAPLVSEAAAPQHQRSYLHYVLEHPELVAAKCMATAWLFSELAPCPRVCEYFGGAGITTVILRALGHGGETHVALDCSSQCVEQLSSFRGVHAEVRDVKQTVNPVHADLQVLDFAAFTVLHWDEWPVLESVFTSGAQAIAWTDTALSYFALHRARYGVRLGARLSTVHDYGAALSAWLERRYGYHIRRAAQRGRNAIYYLALPAAGDLVQRTFPLDQCRGGFIWQAA